MNLFDLSGKTALVTGAAGLLGCEHASALCEAGCGIVIVDRDKHKLQLLYERLNSDFPNSLIEARALDTTDEDSVCSLGVELDHLGISPNVLVNNAAPNPGFQRSEVEVDNSFENYELSRWNDEIREGLQSTFNCTKVFGSRMAHRGSGSIINVASDLSVISPDQRIYSDNESEPDFRRSKPVTYSVSKTALIGLTRYLATYWANRNVRVNALSPGGVFDGQDANFVKRLSFRIPMARMASKSEYRGAIVFLSSNESAYLTGQNLVIDGGRSVW